MSADTCHHPRTDVQVTQAWCGPGCSASCFLPQLRPQWSSHEPLLVPAKCHPQNQKRSSTGPSRH